MILLLYFFFRYRRFVAFDEVAKPRGPIMPLKNIKEANTDDMFKPFDYKPHDYNQELLPMPNKDDMKIYLRYLKIGRTGQTLPLCKQDLNLYMNFIKAVRPPYKEDFINYEECLEKVDIRQNDENEEYSECLKEFSIFQ